MAALPYNTYGLDIEVDTSDGVVDPAVCRITAIGLSARGFDEIYTGDEAQMLRDLDARLASLEPGIIATWNGSMFDLPFLATRSALLGIRTGLVLVEDTNGVTGRDSLPGRVVAHRAAWGEHRHLDTFRLYGDCTPVAPWTVLLGRVRRRGLIADTGNILNEALHAHAASDSRLARVLAERRGPAALREVDRIEPAAVAAVQPTRARREPSVRLVPTPAVI